MQKLPGSNPQRTAPVRQSLGASDAVLLLLVTILFLFVAWFRSRNHIFWSDEIMGWFVLRQPTWPKLFHLWSEGIDSSGIFFYVFGRPWLALFGANEMAIRLYSALGVTLSVVVTWLCARRFFPVYVVAAVVPLIFISNHAALWQLANGRTYGLLMAAVALSAYALLRTSPELPGSSGPWPLLLTFLALLLLTGSHILGMLYWGAFFAGFLARDLCFRTFRPKVYFAAVAALIVVPFSWRNIQSTAALGKPSFWTLPPDRWDLLRGLDVYSRFLGALILVALIALVAVVLAAQAEGSSVSFMNPRDRSLYCLLGVFPFLLITMFAVSHVSTSVFVDRYLLPMLVGDVLLVCTLLGRCFEIVQPTRKVRLCFSAVAALVFIFVYQKNMRFETFYPQRDYTPALLAALPSREPIVMTSVGIFAEMVFYHNGDRTFLMPIDWKIQLDPDNGPGGVSGLHEMENWKVVGLYSSQIQPTSDILHGQSHFAVISDNEHTLWFRRYIAANPAYRTRELEPFGLLHIWQVDLR